MGAVADAVRQRLMTVRVEAIAIEQLLTSGGGADKRIRRVLNDLLDGLGTLEVLLDKEDAA
jgi:hypothetical protein